MPSTLHEDVRRGIEEYLDTNWSLTSVKYINVDLDTSALSRYLEYDIIGILGSLLTLGGDSTNQVGQRRNYDLLLICRIQLEKGTGEAYQMFDIIENLFNMVTITTNLGRRLEFGVPNPPVLVGSDNPSWKKYEVRVSFKLDT